MSKNLATLTLMSLYIYKLALTGDLVYYIHPRYNLFTIIASMVCLFIVIQLIEKKTDEHHHAHEESEHTDHTHVKKDILSLVIIAVIIVAIIVPAQGLSNSTASKRFQKNAKVIPRSQDKKWEAIDNKNGKSSGEVFSDWISQLDEHGKDLTLYQGKDIDVTGFVLINKEKNQGEEIFVTRFFVSCCVADATPLGIQIQYSGNDLANDEWVRVRGKILIVTENGHERATIVPDTIEVVTEPEEPYAYF
jgi:uncharacterized repeat protein (TIGR03943 family)